MRLLILPALALVLIACGGEGPAEAEKPTRTATVTATVAATATPEPTATTAPAPDEDAEAAYIAAMGLYLPLLRDATEEAGAVLVETTTYNAAWQQRVYAAQDDVILWAELLLALDSPSARFDASHGAMTASMRKMIEAGGLVKLGVRLYDPDTINEATRLYGEASALLAEATALLPTID